MLSKSIDRLDKELASMRADFNTLRSEARSDFNTLRSEARGDFNTLRSEARGDFRLTFGALIATAIGLAGLIAKGFHWF